MSIQQMSHFSYLNSVHLRGAESKGVQAAHKHAISYCVTFLRILDFSKLLSKLTFKAEALLTVALK